MDRIIDYLILGAGPAGLQLGYFLEKAGRDYLILERGAPGAFFERFPRHRQLISINKLYTGYDDFERNLRWDWNSLLGGEADPPFGACSDAYFPPAEAMVRYLRDFAERHALRIERGVDVTRVSDDGGAFQVVERGGRSYRGRRLIVATGNAKPLVPDIPGIELADQYVDVSVDPKEFVNQRVLIVGKGNSAFETADNLVATAAVIHIVSPRPVMMAWKTRYVGHLRAVNNNVLDTYLLKSQNAVLDGDVERIERKGDKLYVSLVYTHSGAERETIAYDRVIVCAGFRFDDSIFAPEVKPIIGSEGKYPAQTSEYESVNVRDMYFAGALMQSRDYRKTNSAFIHGFRYNVRALHRILERKHHDVELPSRALAATPVGVAAAILSRVNRSSALWQQFGYLADLVVVPPEGAARYYEELPVDYIRDADLSEGHDSYVVTLEFSAHDGDPFAVLRYPDPARAHLSTEIHPVIRRYVRGSMVAEQHLLENLLGEFDSGCHSEALLAFLRRHMGSRGG